LSDPQQCLNLHDNTSIIWWHVWLTSFCFGNNDIFFSLLLDFNVCLYKFSNQPFNLFCFKIWSLFFFLKIIYEIGIFLQFYHPLIFFYLSNLVLIILIASFFIFLIEFVFQLHLWMLYFILFLF
jgi:hypothetical protein